MALEGAFSFPVDGFGGAGAATRRHVSSSAVQRRPRSAPHPHPPAPRGAQGAKLGNAAAAVAVGAAVRFLVPIPYGVEPEVRVASSNSLL
jgi:hypothetical protein